MKGGGVDEMDQQWTMGIGAVFVLYSMVSMSFKGFLLLAACTDHDRTLALGGTLVSVAL